MKLGKVIGQVWPHRRSINLGPETLLLVSLLEEKAGDLSPNGQVVVALDNLASSTGDLVSLAFGSAARNVLGVPPNRQILADAAVGRIIDGIGED